MDERVRRILEYDKITRQISTHAVSVLGSQCCIALAPSPNFEVVQQALLISTDADTAWTRTGGNPMQAFFDCRDLLQRCAIGGIPAAPELLEAASTLRAIRLVKTKLSQCEGIERIKVLADSLSAQQHTEQEIFRCIVNEEEIADDASPELRNIRRQIRIATEQVRQKLNEIISSASMRTMLQDNIITMRNGRYVVPVKAEYAGTVSGLEHDRSSSGATVFIEPLAVLQANNALREYQAAERNEIQRILQMLGQLLEDQCESISYSIETMGELDLLFAKVAWGRSQKALCPVMHTSGELSLKGARHPLIAREAVVPIDIICGGETKALIITGPNTGGKTVTLKTVGLFILLAQSGVFLPCIKAELPCYDALFADIGDEQSIEQSLSTFSSHMVNLVDILQKAREKTMVLVDELGVGTDPVEGAALAIALLQALTKKGADVIATTHYSELKSFAMSEPGYVNAGMEFDLTTLRPTFKLLTCFAGSSNAFEISRRLGLPGDVIDNAKEHVSQEAMRLESAIQAAEALRLAAQKQLDQTILDSKEERQVLQGELDALRLQMLKDEQRSKEMLLKAQRTLELARQQADEAIEQARLAASAENRVERERLLQSARISQKALADLKSELEEDMTEQDNRQIPKNINVGDSVYVLSLRTKATVLTKPDSKGDVMVQAGILKLSVSQDQIRIAETAEERAKNASRVTREDKGVPMEIDVRGLTVDEAIIVIDMHLDAAYLSSMLQTSIIHGKGTGALRKGVRDYLKRHPHIKSIRSGGYGEGDEGVTIVELK